ncbi:MAG TPA: hypothetical protein VM734_00630 [Kofleriaceae bacterium]|jgi:hypothetical protein|nr:hypothetical protein [Kofleriaceae bacterium]
MKSMTVIAMFAAAVLFAGCKKEEKAAGTGTAAGTAEGTAAKPSEGTAPAPGTAPGTAAGTEAGTAAGTEAGTAAGGGTATPVEPGTGTATPPAATGPAPSDAEVAAAVDKATKLFTDLGNAVEKNAKDCGAMATAIEKAIDSHKDFIQESQKWKGNQAAEAKLLEGLQKTGVMETTMQKMMPGLQACGSDPKVEAALKKMEM